MDNNALSPRVPPGFRFHPTDEELVDYYLKKKVESKSIDLDVIRDVDLYRLEPWDLQEQCRIGHEEQTEWYFFSHKDKKYPTGTRTNRATVAGFWKATGRDKAIYAKLKLIGMRKTLVFYKGRAPNGQKTDWIMHEYRLETNENAPPQEEGWVVCRAFRKRASHLQHVHAHALKRSSLLLLESTSNYYHDHLNTTTALPFSSSGSNNHDHDHGVRRYIGTGTGTAASLQPSLPEMLSRNPHHEYQRAYACKQEEEEAAAAAATAVDLESLENLDYPSFNASFMQLPQLESPKLPSSSSSNNSANATTNTNNSSSCGSSTAVTNAVTTTTEQSMSSLLESISMGVLLPGTGTGEAQAQPHMTTDWKVLDRLVASQLMDSAAAAAVHGQIPLHQYNNGGGTTNSSSSLFSSPFPLSLSTESLMSTLLVRQSNKATAESPDCEASSSVCDVHQDDDFIWGGFGP